MFKIKCKIVIGLLCTLLVGCSFDDEHIVPPVTQLQAEFNNSTVEEYENTLVELCDFLSYFVEKTYAPKSQNDIDVSVGNAIEIIDLTTMFHFLISLPKEMNQDSYVDILQVSYAYDSDFISNIIIKFDLYLAGNPSTKYVRFDFDDDNMITNIQEYYRK